VHADQTVPPPAGPGRAAPLRAWLSFRRIVDVPFGTCLAALESGQITGPHGGRRAGQPLVCGPVEHDPDSGTCQVQVRLARGPLRPPLRMRLQADHWSSSPPRTALDLIPCGHARPSAAYFRAGHLLLDQLARSLARPVPAQRPDRAAASQPHSDQGQPGPAPSRTAQYQPTPGQEHDMARFMDFHQDLKLPAEAIAQIAEDARNATADRFGVRQIELYHNPDGQVYCLLQGPDENAIRQHHAALGVPCGDVHQVDSLS
jgi:hypothetical protein